MENYICYPIENFQDGGALAGPPPGSDPCTFIALTKRTKKFISDNNCSPDAYIPIFDGDDLRCNNRDNLDDDEKKACDGPNSNLGRINMPGSDPCVRNPASLTKKYMSDNNCKFEYIPITDESDSRCSYEEGLDLEEKVACGKIKPRGSDPCIRNPASLTKKYISDNNCKFEYIPITDKSDSRCSYEDLDEDEKKACAKNSNNIKDSKDISGNKMYGNSNINKPEIELKKILRSNKFNLDYTTILIFVVFIFGMFISFFFFNQNN